MPTAQSAPIATAAAAAAVLPIPDYPVPCFEPGDYYDPRLSQLVVDNSPQRPHSPYRRPPVIHLHWMWLLMRVIGVLLQAVNWFTRRVDAHRTKPSLHHVPVASYYDVGLTKEEMDGGMGDSALRALLPGFVVSTAEFIDSSVVMPAWSMLHRLRVAAVPSQWRGVSQRPALYLVYALSTLVYGALNSVLAVLTALTGQKRSWVSRLSTLILSHPSARQQQSCLMADDVCCTCFTLDVGR